MEKKKIVIALGGNALGKDVEEQKVAVAKTAKVIVDLMQQGMDIIITHGNGPQVGMIQNAMDNTAQEYYGGSAMGMAIDETFTRETISHCQELLFIYGNAGF